MFDWVDNWVDKVKTIEFNAFQTISITGMIATLFSHAGLFLRGKDIDKFWYVYIVWMFIFLAATYVRLKDNEHSEDHHSH